MTASARWRDIQEKGSAWGMFLTVMAYRMFGRWAAEPILRVVVAYFYIKDRALRQASAQYLARVGRHGRGEVYRHCLSFAQTSLDRFDVWSDRLDDYTLTYHGEEHLLRLHQENKGALLIGAHLGNFDMLSAMAKRHDAKVHVLMDRRNAQKITALLKRFCPGMERGIVDYDTGSLTGVFELKQTIQRGEYIALLGDRIAAESTRGASRVSAADFLGSPAFLPTAPFLFAAHMQCPVFLVFGLKRAARIYDVYIEPFADPLTLPEESRTAALADYVRAYAARLEHYCRLYPLQWFNFYDFWRPQS